jgi:hypothetical protein
MLRLLFYRRIKFKSLRNYLGIVLVTSQLKHNGPAVVFVYVAERLEAGKQCPGRKYNAMRPEGAKHGACFCHLVASILSFTSIAVQSRLKSGSCPLIVILLKVLAGSVPESKRSGDRGR